MTKFKLISAFYFLAVSAVSYGQNKQDTQTADVAPKVIAVVNNAQWCNVCKANGERFGNNISTYTTKGLSIVMNDLTNDSTISISKNVLKKSAVYKQIYKTKRKGVGRMMQSCGLIHGKEKSMVSGIVTFIDAKSLRVMSESSIAVSDNEMKTIIDNQLNSK